METILERKEAEKDFSYVKRLYSPGSKQSDFLYNAVFKPVEQYLKNVKTIYVSPVGLLNRIAFDALKSDSTTILSDKYNIYYTSTTATRINEKGLYQNNIKSAVLFGGIEYDLKPEKMLANANLIKLRTESTTQAVFGYANPVAGLNQRNLDSLTRNVSWTYLEDSMLETEEIENVLTKKNNAVKLYSDQFGSEEQFKALENDAPSILHVSTHGFYFGDDKKSEMYKDLIDKDVEFAHSENPLLRSGFILAGGNAAFQGKSLPEGVEYLLFSLWEVPDYQMRELMTNFYKNWFSGMEIRVAFKKKHRIN